MQLDIYDDHGKLLTQYYSRVTDLPDWVQDGLKGTRFQEDPQKLASNDFAVSVPVIGGVKHAYPVYSDAMTAISCFYFDHTHQRLPVELQKQAAVTLLEACNQFEIKPSEKIAELATEYQEQKTAATPLRLPFQSQGITGSSLFPLDTPEQVKTASVLYDKILQKLHPTQRREFSVNLREKSAEFGLPVSEKVHRWGGDRLSVVAVTEGIEKRAAYMDEAQLALLRKTTDRILELHPDKVAELLEDMDAELGLDTLWGRGIPDPRAIYEMSNAPAIVKVAGVEIPEEQWHAACDMGLLDSLAPGMQGALRKNPELIGQYDGHPLQEYILEGLESLGVVAREQAQA